MALNYPRTKYFEENKIIMFHRNQLLTSADLFTMEYWNKCKAKSVVVRMNQVLLECPKIEIFWKVLISQVFILRFIYEKHLGQRISTKESVLWVPQALSVFSTLATYNGP